MNTSEQNSQGTEKLESLSYLRFPVATRILHWLAAGLILTLLWSGFWIFNLHPRLYWGDVGNFDTPAIAELAADTTGDEPQMAIVIGSLSLDVTGIMGRVNRQPYVRVFNFPQNFEFGGTRALHFTAAWGLLLCWIYYLRHLLNSGRLRRNWLPRATELTPKNLGVDLLNHLRFRRARGEAAKNYNILQKLSYLTVMFVLLPLILLTGLTMSNSVTTAWPFLFDLFGGRQSARTLHFIFAFLIVLFILIHLVQLLVIGIVNHGRAMITGRFEIKPEKE